MEKEEKKKKKAKIQLLIFFIFIVFAFTYTKMLSFRSNKYNNVENTNEKVQYTLDELKNYNFNINISVVENNINKSYYYSGRIDDKNGSITTEENTYQIINNLYYDNNYEQVNDLFYKIDNKYLDISNIKAYINEADYNNNTYEVHLTEVISNKVENFVIYINETYSSNNIIIKIDYSNLVKLYYPDINSYIVNYILSNFK